MFKVMALLKRKPGMSREDFVRHYETRHAPIGVEIQTTMRRYVRRHLSPLPYPLTGAVLEPEYDVLTEMWFRDRNGYDTLAATLQKPDVAARLRADRENFMDTSGTQRMAMVEDRESVLPWVTKTPGPNCFKILALLKRKPGLSLDTFIDYYETKHAPLGIRTQRIMVRYMRHYLHPLPYPVTGAVAEPEYDVVTEIWFADRQAYDNRTALLAQPEITARIAEDEKNFMHMDKRRIALPDDRESVLP